MYWGLLACSFLTACAICMGLLPLIACELFPQFNADLYGSRDRGSREQQGEGSCNTPSGRARMKPLVIRFVVWSAVAGLAWMLYIAPPSTWRFYFDRLRLP